MDIFPINHPLLQYTSRSVENKAISREKSFTRNRPVACLRQKTRWYWWWGLLCVCVCLLCEWQTRSWLMCLAFIFAIIFWCNANHCCVAVGAVLFPESTWRSNRLKLGFSGSRCWGACFISLNLNTDVTDFMRRSLVVSCFFKFYFRMPDILVIL